MISVLSVTDRYILQPALIAKHKKTLEWISATILWKQEINFFQQLLDRYSPKFTSVEDKKQLSHLQSIITYYNGDLLGYLSTKLRMHEKRLAELLEKKDETNTEYFREHDGLMGELESLNTQLADYKIELFRLIEKVL